MADQTITGLRAGVLHGDEIQSLFKNAKANAFALPAVNVTGTNTVNAVLETAKAVNSPVIIQFSNKSRWTSAFMGSVKGTVVSPLCGLG